MNKTDIAKLIPHAGAMCLLDGVLRWDAVNICCTTASHRDPGNSLRSRGRLHAICGIEYAGQAMALHGALAGSVERRPRSGYLASVRDVVCRIERLDILPGELVIEAEALLADAQHVVYRFALHSDAVELLSGRAAVVLDIEAAA